MNAERVPFEALKERSRGCFGGFRLSARSPASRSLAEGRRFGEGGSSEACGGAAGFISPWGSTFYHEGLKGLLDNHEFDPSVLCTTLIGFIVGHRLRAAIALYRHPTLRNVVLILNVFLGTLGSLFGNLLVRCF